MPSRIDILIERAKRRAATESGPNASQGAATGPAQIEYLVSAGALHRCEGCSAVVPSVTRWRGMSLCDDCLHVATHADFQDTAPGYAP